MGEKLIKTKTGFYLWKNPLDKSQELIGATVPIMNDNGVDLREYKLSLKNCQAIERGYDLDELAKIEYPICEVWNDEEALIRELAFKKGFQKAMELMSDKKFSEEQLKIAADWYFETKGKKSIDEYIQSLQQTEWEVEVEMEVVPDFYSRSDQDGSIFTSNKKEIPKLDADGCLILKIKSE